MNREESHSLKSRSASDYIAICTYVCVDVGVEI